MAEVMAEVMAEMMTKMMIRIALEPRTIRGGQQVAEY